MAREIAGGNSCDLSGCTQGSGLPIHGSAAEWKHSRGIKGTAVIILRPPFFSPARTGDNSSTATSSGPTIQHNRVAEGESGQRVPEIADGGRDASLTCTEWAVGGPHAIDSPIPIRALPRLGQHAAGSPFLRLLRLLQKSDSIAHCWMLIPLLHR